MLAERVTAAEALRAVVDALQGTAPLGEVLQSVVEQARAFLEADEAYLLLTEGDRLVLRAADGLPAGAVGTAIPAVVGVEGAAVTSRRTLEVGDAGAEPRFVDHFGRAVPPRALAAVPMLVRGAAIGVLVAARRSGGHLGGATLWWLELLAGLAAAAAAQDGAVRVHERRAREAEVLLALTDVSNEEPTRFAARLADAIGRCLGLDFADLLIHDEERGELSVLAGGADARIVRSGGVGVDRVPAGSDHPAARAFASGQPYLRADVRDDPAARAAFAGRPVRAVAAVPVRVGSEPRGVLHLAARAPGAIGRPDLPFLQIVAARATLLLEREDVHRRRAEARAREEFVGVVSHELKTPVAVTSAYVELLQRRAEREGRRGDLDVLARIADENQRMLAMVEELLDVQRIDAGVLHLELSRFDLAALAERVAEGLQLTTAAHRIVVASREPVVVLADRRRIEEILTNLLENAIKYSPGGGEVRVTACRDGTGPLPLARVEVADQGVGIAPEDQARILDRFQRGGAGGRLHRGHHGLGLGLYIARELVHRHGGEMGVRSAPGKGSTFWFTLPTDGPAADD